MDITHKLRINYVAELHKPEISYWERARIIEAIMGQEQLSQQGFCSKYGFAKSTVAHWLNWLKIDEEEYDNLLTEGYDDKAINEMLKQNRMVKTQPNKVAMIDNMLARIMVMMEKMTHIKRITGKTEHLLSDCEASFKKLKEHIEHIKSFRNMMIQK